jgi:hypothetical protein
VLPLSVDQSKKHLSRWLNFITYGQPRRNCSSALHLSVVCILTRNCTEGSGVCLDRMRDFFVDHENVALHMVSKQTLTSAGNDFEFPMGSKSNKTCQGP